MGDKIRSKYNSENNSDSDDDDNNVTYYGDPILAIEWNEAALIQRNVQKNTILTYIRSFRGCMPFPNTDQTQSDSLFFVVKRPGVPAQQIIY
ncbi:3907_t:CDS:2, partial [Gigaspora rosea]